jgi:hypothetical protein
LESAPRTKRLKISRCSGAGNADSLITRHNRHAVRPTHQRPLGDLLTRLPEILQE